MFRRLKLFHQLLKFRGFANGIKIRIGAELIIIYIACIYRLSKSQEAFFDFAMTEENTCCIIQRKSVSVWK